jgi:hypothetical protein
VEIRLDARAAEALGNLAAEKKATVSEVMREALWRLYDEYRRERRRLAVERLAAMEIEEMPDPEELARQMNKTYAVDLP